MSTASIIAGIIAVVILVIWWRCEIRTQREYNKLLIEMELTHRRWDRNRDPDLEHTCPRHGPAPSRDSAE